MKTFTSLIFIFIIITVLQIGNLFAGDNKNNPFNQTEIKGLIRYNNVTKSKQDTSVYRALQLTNNLRVLLISDSTTDMSAASMAVGVGSINDYKEIPGLAHFLEHMVFMGSKKYPTENDYQKFISEHAGAYNAFTDTSVTNFMFEIDSDTLQPLLDRFSQFYLDPLILESAMQREANAVDSEYKRHVQEDDWRFDQMLRTLSKPDHPYNHFFIGNLETLITDPQSKNISTHEKLLDFHFQWYSSNIMNLVVLGKESLEDLENMTIPLFNNVKNKNVANVPYSYNEHPWGPGQLRHKVYIVPVSDINKIRLVFPIPDTKNQYKAGPAGYLEDLIGGEAPGSLLYVLKDMGLCTSSYVYDTSEDGIAFFHIWFDLTEQAMNNISDSTDQIITLVFQYIHLIEEQGVQERIFEEHKKILEIAFDYRDKKEPLDYVKAITTNMQYYPMEDIISYMVPRQWEPTLIQQFLSYLKPDNMNVIIISQSFQNVTNQIEPWFKINYQVEPIQDDLIQKWNSSGLSSDLHLPTPNEFIPQNFDLYPLVGNVTKSPFIIKDTSTSRIWFKQDDEYKKPKLNTYFELISPIANKDANNRNLLEMFVILFQDSMGDYTNSAVIAGLEWSLSTTSYGLELSLSGFNDKLPVLLDKISSRLANFTMNSKRFKNLKDQYVRSLKNFETQDLPEFSNKQLQYLTNEQEWTNDQFLAAIEILQEDNIKKFVSELFSSIFIQGLIYGNCNKQKAIEIIDVIEKPFRSAKVVPPAQLSLLRIVNVKEGSNLMYEVRNQYHDLSCYMAYIQCTIESIQINTLVELFYTTVKESCFNVLRTQEQLGYIVYCQTSFTRGVRGFLIVVESPKDLIFINSRVEAFLLTVQKNLEAMTDEEFNTYKTSMQQRIMEKPKALEIKADKYWTEIKTRLYDFDRDEQMAEQLKSLQKKDVIEFFKQYIAKSSKTRAKLDIHVISTVSNSTTSSNVLVEETKIQDIESFQKTAVFFPPPKPDINIAPIGTASCPSPP